MMERGHTLLEMLIVVAILAIGAAIAVPDSRPARQEKLILATSIAAEAFRFARDEAARTGNVHGVFVDIANNRLDVFRLDETTNPNAAVLDVRHPVSKQLYRVQLGTGALTYVALQNQSQTLVGSCSLVTYVGIDPTGATICTEPTTTRIENVSLTLGYDGIAMTVAIDSYTGRTTLQ